MSTTDLKSFAAFLCWGLWSRVLNWYYGRNIAPCKATVQQITVIFVSALGIEATCSDDKGL